ncbi:MAG: PKD domain-containing protein [Candidatus Pacebacteria bacterium]|nr:PKD domain-containing protein [Candidatus Paceibacterota bacterium]
MKNITEKMFHSFVGITFAVFVLVAGLLSFSTMASAQTPQVCTAPLDVVLVFDRSHSMGYDTEYLGGGNYGPIQPLTDAQNGTIAFIDILTSNDAVGLVDFYGNAVLTNILTTTFSTVSSNVGLDWLLGWTNTGAGIDTAHAELLANGRDDIKQIMIVLSDGNPTKPGNESDAATYALQQASEAKADGIIIYTIGFGNDVNPSFLENIASDPSYYFYTPTSAGLEDVYMALAEIACELDDKEIQAKALLDHNCDHDEWHFVINQIDDEENAPATIHVTWANGNNEDLSLDDPFTGGVADYRSTGNLDSTVTSATATIYEEWDGQFNLSHGPDVCPILGSINICKIVINEEGEIVGGSENDGNFTVEGIEVTNHPTVDDSVDVLASAYFETSLTFNADLIGGDGVNDAQCIPYDDLAMGGYFYSEEVIVGNNWFTPLYNDGANMSLVSLGNFFPYSGELFTDDGGVDDNGRNTNADGHIVLSESRPDRTLIILNQYEVPDVPPHYGPYCGDGNIDTQLGEQCDTGHLVGGAPQLGCSVQCQPITGECSEKVFARAVVTKVQNEQGTEGMTSDIFLGTDTLPIPSEAWFMTYDGSSYIDDPDVNGYEDVPGLAVQRDNGSITVRHFGSHPNECIQKREHVEGYLEFYNAGILDVANDDNPSQNKMENWGPDMVAQKAINAGKDAAWIEGNKSHFWMTVTVADDSYFTNWGPIPVCEVVNEAPIAILKADPTTVYVGENVAFDAASSTDDVGIVEYLIEFGDGATSSLSVISHSYGATGTYFAVLTVTDGEGATSTDMVEVTVIPEDVPVCPSVVVVSNTEDMVVGGSNAIETYDEHTAWTAIIELATWIWEHYYVQNPETEETVNFTKDFGIIGLPATTTLMVAADNTYTVRVNGVEVATSTDENNFQLETQDEYDVTGMLHAGINTISFEVTNLEQPGGTPQSNPAGLLYRLEVEIEGDSCLMENTEPEIFGADTPLILYVGDTGIDTLAMAGVTADDTEDGDLTSEIDVDVSGIDTSIVGTTSITYTVDDHGHPTGINILSDTVIREVQVVAVGVNIAPTAIITGVTTVILGNPIMLSATSSDDTDGTIEEYLWEFDGATSSADTMSHTYSATGTYPVVLTVTDNDGATSTDTVNVIVEEEAVEENQQPVITLIYSTLTLTVGDSFDEFGGHATADDVEDGDITGDMIATSTVNTAAAGSYTVEYGVKDLEGLAADPKTLIVTVNNKTVVSGGGGGGGGYYPMLYINDEHVEYLGGGSALVTWTTNLSATSQVVYGDESISSVGSPALYGYDAKNDENTVLTKDHSMTITGLTDGMQYWFRPVSDRAWSAEVYGDEVTYTFQPIVEPTQCVYLLEYIQLGAANNPVEVEKLERFLNEYEGESLAVNGLYEQADFEAVERFQIKYRESILDPWNHDAATGYVYITTKKKINEIYCNSEFPLNTGQEAEIAAFSALLQGIAQVATTDSTDDIEEIDYGSTVGLGSDDEEGTTLADATTDTDTESIQTQKGLLAGILGVLGFGDDEKETVDAEDTKVVEVEDGEEDELLADVTEDTDEKRTLAAVVLGGVMTVATSYWFIFLLAVFAVILFLRIRGAEKA